MTRVAAVVLPFTLVIVLASESAGAQRRYPIGYGGPLDPYTVALRVDAEPEEAEVYVNGHLAGKVDDFDGVFQRLRLRPGENEIVLYLDGYRTVHERRYFNPHSSETIRLTMQPLGAGESQEPRPVPAARPAPPPDPRIPTRPAPSDPRPTEQVVRQGTLSIRVQPADAEIRIDGAADVVRATQGVIAIQLAPGRHKIDIRREGYQPYVEEVLIQSGRTLTVDVNLTRK